MLCADLRASFPDPLHSPAQLSRGSTGAPVALVPYSSPRADTWQRCATLHKACNALATSLQGLPRARAAASYPKAPGPQQPTKATERHRQGTGAATTATTAPRAQDRPTRPAKRPRAPRQRQRALGATTTPAPRYPKAPRPTVRPNRRPPIPKAQHQGSGQLPKSTRGTTTTPGQKKGRHPDQAPPTTPTPLSVLSPHHCHHQAQRPGHRPKRVF